MSGWAVLFWFFLGCLVLAGLVLLVWTASNLLRLGGRRWRMDGRFPRDRIRLLREAGQRLGGEVVDNPRAFRFPYLRSIPPEEPLAVVLHPVEEETRDPAAPYIVRVEAPVLGGRYVELWPTGSPLAPARVNLEPMEFRTGDAGFDGRYVVRADDRSFATALVDEGFRGALQRAWGTGIGGRVRVELDGYRLRLQKEEQLSNAQDLAALAEAARDLRSRVRAALEEVAAVQFLDAPAPAQKPSCPVCGAEMRGPKVSCRRCRTPHHRECWEYTGRCSMFACGEAQFSS